MKIKRLISYVVMISLVFSLCTACAQTSNYPTVNFNFDGYDIPLSDKCLLINSTTMIPMREIFTNIGTTISWNDETQTATAKADGYLVEVTKDSDIIRINGSEVKMPAKSVTVNSKMYIPLRAVGEALGFEVDYSEKFNTAYVFSQKRENLAVPEISVTTQVLSDDDKAWLSSTLDGAVKKVARTVGRTRGNVCYSTQSGLYTNKGAEKTNWWTNGFYPGILWIMYENTLDQRYAQYAQELENKLAEGFSETETLDHDMGFLWMNSGMRNYTLTGNETSKANVIKAAEILYGRYERDAKFIVAWNGENNTDRSIIDTMMNLDLLYTATNLTRNPVYAKAASNHADTTIKNFIRDDGSCQHQVTMNLANGKKTGVYPGQGYDDGKNDGSHWARGNAWALYGFAKCFGYTGDIKYLETSEKIAKYYKENFRNGYDVPMDFNQPSYVDLVDTSAAAIAASGYIDLARHTDKAEYLETAINLLKNLTSKYGGNNGEEALLTHGCVIYSNPVQQSLIYADLYYLEALMKLRDFSY